MPPLPPSSQGPVPCCDIGLLGGTNLKLSAGSCHLAGTLPVPVPAPGYPSLMPSSRLPLIRWPQPTLQWPLRSVGLNRGQQRPHHHYPTGGAFRFSGPLPAQVWEEAGLQWLDRLPCEEPEPRQPALIQKPGNSSPEQLREVMRKPF